MRQRDLKGLAPLAEVDSDTKKVHNELAVRLERLRTQGMVDLKVTVNPSKRSSSRNWLWVLNNVLRQREDGRCETTVLKG